MTLDYKAKELLLIDELRKINVEGATMPVGSGFYLDRDGKRINYDVILTLHKEGNYPRD